MIKTLTLALTSSGIRIDSGRILLLRAGAGNTTKTQTKSGIQCPASG